MAHHDNTPSRILNAPERTSTAVHTSKGLSRDERRGRVAVSAKRRMSAAGKTNTPFVGKVADLIAQDRS